MRFSKAQWVLLAASLAFILAGATLASQLIEATQDTAQPGPELAAPSATETAGLPTTNTDADALSVLETLAVKGRAPRTGYSREQFSDGWGRIDGCDLRNLMLQRDLTDVVLRDNCIVETGTLQDPYTATEIRFLRGVETSLEVQIDHVVAVSDAWQKGAQQLSEQRRYEFYNDPLNLLAVSGAANQAKSDADAASWLPPNRAFRCEFVAIQIAVKARYELWVTAAERDSMRRVLRLCPDQQLPNR